MIFNFNSGVFKLSGVLTFTLFFFNLVSLFHNVFSPTEISFLILGILASLIAFCALFPWYKRAYRGLGIEEHFRKIFTYSLYPFLIANLVFTLKGPGLVLNLILSGLMTFVLVINAILLSYHFRDPDKTPPAYFAANLYLTKESV